MPQTSKKNPTQKRFLLLFFIGLTALAALIESRSIELLPYSSANAQSAVDLKKSEEQVRAEMIKISEELGLTCLDCHNTNNFTSDEKRNFKIAQEHIKITEMLRQNGFDGKLGPEASCYMCHRGVLKPPYLDPKSQKK